MVQSLANICRPTQRFCKVQLSTMYRISRTTTSTDSVTAGSMVSKLEHALLRCKRDDGSFRKAFYQYLDDPATLRHLRGVSRVLRDLVEHQPGRMFRRLYMNAPFRTSDSPTTLETVAPFCYSLTIKVGYPENPFEDKAPSIASTWNRLSDPSPRGSQDLIQRFWERRPLSHTSGQRSSASSSRQSFTSTLPNNASGRASIPPSRLSHERRRQNEAQQLWTAILSRFHQLNAITLRVNGDLAWPGCTDVEDMLVTLRVAIEQADIPHLRTVCLGPVHAMGIIHLRWLGIGAFVQAQAAGADVWRSIDTLDLRIYSPFATREVTEAQGSMFKKILYDYLRSFAPSLRCLRLVWLGGDGPSPLTLHLDPELEGRSEILWPKLEELWIGNILQPRRTIKLTPRLAPSVTCLKSLRSTRRDSSMDASDSSAWVEVLGLPESGEFAESDRGSSIYSQSALSEGSAWMGGISRSSRDLQFMLDI